MTGASRVPRARHLVCLLLVVLVALAAQVAYAPRAEAIPPRGTVRDTRVTQLADEVVTVDVLGIDDPAPARTWVRSSVCLFWWQGRCEKTMSEDGITALVNSDGTITTYRSSRSGATAAFPYVVQDSAGSHDGARLLVTVRPSAAALVADPDPAVRARLRVTAWKRYFYFDHAGQTLKFGSTVTNTGNVALEGLALTNASPHVPAPTCSPVGVGGTLPAGATTTCLSTLTVTQDLLDRNVVRENRVTATGQAARQGISYRAQAAALASASPIRKPRLSMTASADPAVVSSATQPVAYTFVPKNTGLVTLRHLLVWAPIPGLSALVCSPVPLGGDLAPGQSTTCRGTRTIPPDRLGRTELVDTAKASAEWQLATSNAGSRVRVALTTQAPSPSEPVEAPAPVARPDTVSTHLGQPVVVGVLDNDSPGAPAVPLVGSSVRLRLDPSLPSGLPVLYGDAKTLVVPAKDGPDDPVGGVFLVSGRGEITFVPRGTVPYQDLRVGYQVADANGRTARSTFTVTVLR